MSGEIDPELKKTSRRHNTLEQAKEQTDRDRREP